ncbi:MAG: ArsC family transcriptional regulator [Opitutae bacterium]|nr:ArsC family transcriptional regulator [Opitutae bacterium]
MKIYIYDKCGTCRKALNWLDLNDLIYAKIPIRDNPPSKTDLKKMLKAKNGEVKKLFNTSSKDYRDPAVKDRLPFLSVDQAIDMLNSRGNLIKRPFLLSEEIALIGFKEEEWSSVFGAK